MRLSPKLVLAITMFVVTTAAVPVPVNDEVKRNKYMGEPLLGSQGSSSSPPQELLEMQRPPSSPPSLPGSSKSPAALTATPKLSPSYGWQSGPDVGPQTQTEWFNRAVDLQKKYPQRMGAYKRVSITLKRDQMSARMKFYEAEDPNIQSFIVTVPKVPSADWDPFAPEPLPRSRAAPATPKPSLSFSWVAEQPVGPKTPTEWFNRAEDLQKKYPQRMGAYTMVAISLNRDQMSARMYFHGAQDPKISSFSVTVPKDPRADWDPFAREPLPGSSAPPATPKRSLARSHGSRHLM